MIRESDPQRIQIYNARMVAEAQWSGYYAQRAGELRSELSEEKQTRTTAERRAAEAEAEAQLVERAAEERRAKAEERAQQAEDRLRVRSRRHDEFVSCWCFLLVAAMLLFLLASLGVGGLHRHPQTQNADSIFPFFPPFPSFCGRLCF